MPQTMLAPQPLVRAGVQLALIILLLGAGLGTGQVKAATGFRCAGSAPFDVVMAPAELGAESTPFVRTRAPRWFQAP